MFRIRMTAAAICVSAVLSAVAPVQGQVKQYPVYAPGVNPHAPFYNPVQPIDYVYPGVTRQQLHQKLWLHGPDIGNKTYGPLPPPGAYYFPFRPIIPPPVRYRRPPTVVIVPYRYR